MLSLHFIFVAYEDCTYKVYNRRFLAETHILLATLVSHTISFRISVDFSVACLI